MKATKLLYGPLQARQWGRCIRARPDATKRQLALAELLEINWRYLANRPELEKEVYTMTQGKGKLL